MNYMNGFEKSDGVITTTYIKDYLLSQTSNLPRFNKEYEVALEAGDDGNTLRFSLLIFVFV